MEMKDWILKFEATEEVAAIVEQYVFHMQNTFQTLLEENKEG